MPHSASVEPGINVTPLIDVMLVLLVTLIMTLPVSTHAIKLNLPHSPTGAPPAAITLDIRSEGTLYWDGEPVESVTALMPRLVALAHEAGPTVLHVMPDRRARYEIVAQVLAAAQRAHVSNLTVASVSDSAAD